MKTPIDHNLRSQVILWGGTGQAKVVRPILEQQGARVVAVFDDTPDLTPPFPDVKLYCGWEQFSQWIADQDRSEIGFAVTIGNPHGRARITLHDRLLAEGLAPVSAVHPTAWVSPGAIVGEGAQILAGAIVEIEARLGRQVIVNTKASVDHECVLGDGVEIAPSATLCGLVNVEDYAWVAAGATVRPRVRIGHDAIVGMGSVVTKDVAAGATVVGNPAQPFIKQLPRSTGASTPVRIAS